MTAREALAAKVAQYPEYIMSEEYREELLEIRWEESQEEDKDQIMDCYDWEREITVPIAPEHVIKLLIIFPFLLTD